MLRWKTQSAICAIVIAACPLTSFAQQIEKPARQEASVVQASAVNELKTMLQSRKSVQGEASPEIVIRSPFVQPHNPNLYLFVVENVGTADVTAASFDLSVPKEVTITNVVPASETGNAQLAHVRLTNLAAGSKTTIEVEVSPTTNSFEFLTRMTLESVQTFKTATNPKYVAEPKYLIPRNQVPGLSSPLKRLAPIAMALPAKSAAAVAQDAVDEKLLKTAESLRSAGQNALADAYSAAVKNSKTFRAETF